MGSVYKATDENLGITVAVKENLFSTEEYTRQFKREATILASLRHNNLPRVTDHFVIAGQGQYLVMDFIDGDDLRSRIEKGNLPSERLVLDWARQICDALHYLHRRQPPVVHRDIKPGNIRITPDGRAMLVDFGLARLMEGASTTTGAKAMTPGYSPPEQYGASRTDSRTDIYALAATLYTLFAGMMPEDGLERALGQKSLTPLRTRNSKVSPGVAAAIEKALEVLPENRYQTIGEFFSALDSSVQPMVEAVPQMDSTTRKVQGKTPPPPLPGKQAPQLSAKPVTKQPVPPQKQKKSIGCILGIILVVSLILTGIIVVAVKWNDIRSYFQPFATFISNPHPTTQKETEQPAQPTATLKIANETLIPQTAIVSPTNTPTPEATPIGGSQVFAYVSDKTGMPQVYIRDLKGGVGSQLTSSNDFTEGACQPDWSPDGMALLFISPCENVDGPFIGTAIYKINIDGSGITLLSSMSGGDYDPAWSLDGKKILFTSLQDGMLQHIYVMDINGENRIRLSPKGNKDAQARWAPSGDRIVFVSYGINPAKVMIMESSGGSGSQFSRELIFPALSPDWSVGNNILFVLQSKGQVYIEDYANPKGEKPISDPYKGTTVARFSPDGQQILFDCLMDCTQAERVESKTQRDIYLIPIVGAKVPQRITSDPGNETDPAWRPYRLLP